MNIENIKIADLITDGLQTRFSLDDSTVAEYAEAMNGGAEFPPVTVFRLPISFGNGAQKGEYYLADGFHRIAAAKACGREEIAADVMDGTKTMALKFALSSNLAHGLRRTNADKRRALEIAWANRVELLHTDEPTKRALAALCGVSDFLAYEFMQDRRVVENTKPADGAATTRVNEPVVGTGAKAMLRDGKDRFGVMIPPRLLSAFHAAKLRQTMRDVRAARRDLCAALEENVPAFAAVPQQVLINLDNAIRELRFAEAYCVCRGCGGEGCARCGDRGFQTVMQYRRLPGEFRARA